MQASQQIFFIYITYYLEMFGIDNMGVVAWIEPTGSPVGWPIYTLSTAS